MSPDPTTDQHDAHAPDEVVRDGQPRRSIPLFPLIGIVIALLIGLLVFFATRSGPNYQEEQFTPDSVEQAD